MGKTRARAHGGHRVNSAPLVSASTMDEVEESSERSLPNKSNKGVKRKSDFQAVYCSICKVFVNSSSQATAHYSGKSHQNKVRNQSSVGTAETSMDDSAPVENPPLESFKCDLCQRSFNSESQMNAHLSGKAHQLLAQSKLESTGMGASSDGASSSVASGDETPVIPDAVGDAAAPEQEGPAVSFGSNLTTVFHCAMCNITLNSQKQMEQHNKGLRHKIVIGKAKPPTVAGEKWENVRFMKIANAVMGMNKDSVTGSGGGMNLRQYYCEKCDLTVNSQTQLDQHLLSQKHKLKGTETANGQSKRKRGSIGGHVGCATRQGYQFNNTGTQGHYGARQKVMKPYLPALSMNFVRSSKPILDNVFYPENPNFHIMEQFTPDVSQKWNSNFINYDMPPQNLAMF